MNFRTWLLTEEIVFLKNLVQTHQVISLGKMGLWNVYSAIRTVDPAVVGDANRPPKANHVLTIQDYKKASYRQTAKDDYFVDRIGDVQMHCDNAANALAGIGFPKYTTSMVFMDLTGMKNPITGGGVGGYASSREHAFTVERKNVSEFTIIHEHAHMWWANVLPAQAQGVFIKWYTENVSNWITKPENIAKYAGKVEYPVEEVKEKILKQGLEKQGQSVFYDNLEKILGSSIESYFRLRSAIEESDEGKIIETALMSQHGRYVSAYAIKDLPMSSYTHGFKTVESGGVVKVEKGSSGYIINIFEEYKTPWGDKSHKHFEYDGVIPYDKINKYVRFDKDLLTDEEKQEVDDRIKLAKKKASTFLAPKNKADDIRKAFDAALESTFHYYAKHNGWEFEYDPRMNHFNDWYNTWVSMIGRRGNKGRLKSVQDVLNTFLDATKTKLRFSDDMVPANAEARTKSQIRDIQHSIGSPAGTSLRQAIQQSGMVPTSYAASNYGELWAEVVERAASSPESVSKELKKLLYSILSGTAWSSTTNPTIHRPRRMERRKKKR